MKKSNVDEERFPFRLPRLNNCGALLFVPLIVEGDRLQNSTEKGKLYLRSCRNYSVSIWLNLSLENGIASFSTVDPLAMTG